MYYIKSVLRQDFDMDINRKGIIFILIENEMISLTVYLVKIDIWGRFNVRFRFPLNVIAQETSG